MESQFATLPGEVMERILYYFDVADGQKFRPISKLWNKTISTLYGVTLRVRNISLELSLACKSYPIMGYFQSLTLPIPMNDSGTDFLSRLTSLTFTGAVVCYNIFPVFEQCQQIRKLEFINCIANQNVREYQLHLEDASKLLPSLRALVIKLRYTPFPSPEINFFKRLLPFFTSDSGKLDTIVLDCPCRFGGPLETTFDKIFEKKTILIHRTATSTRMENEGENADEFYNDLLLKNVRTLRNLEMADGGCSCTFKMKFCVENGSQDFSNVQFSEFEQVLYCFYLRHNFSVMADSYMSLTNLLHLQTHLTKLTVAVSRSFPLNHVYTIASQNAETLKILIIFYKRYVGCLDAFSLNQLHVLQNLKFSYFPTYHSEAAYANIDNFNYLPPSLRSLSTTASILFENEDEFNMAAFQHLDKLETLELLVMPYFHFGAEKIYEMEPRRIRQLISWLPSLKKLVLRNIHLIMGQFHDPDPPPITDSLPDTSTDWINDEAGISFQKYPIVIESLNTNENSALIGQSVGWETIYLPIEHPFEFPLHFDGVILIRPEFRQNIASSV